MAEHTARSHLRLPPELKAEVERVAEEGPYLSVAELHRHALRRVVEEHNRGGGDDDE